ncbi:MAG: 3-oxoacyl-ACP reductase FabG [Fidelibacterota bacterium]
MRGLEGKVVIVTGSGQGIGRETALRFAEEGAKVVVAEVNPSTGQRVARELSGSGAEALFVQVDIAHRDSVRQMVAAVNKRFGRIDVLVNNAGVIQDRTLKNMTGDEFDRVIRVNLKGTFVCTQEVVEVMREQGSGVVLNATSVVALYGNFGQTNYVASKSGIIGMTRVWARELGKDGIRVNAVAPGFIMTDMLKDIPKDVLNEKVDKIPLRRMGHPEEVAAVYCFLASEDAGYITGAVLSVDGGVVV